MWLNYDMTQVTNFNYIWKNLCLQITELMTILGPSCDNSFIVLLYFFLTGYNKLRGLGSAQLQASSKCAVFGSDSNNI